MEDPSTARTAIANGIKLDPNVECPEFRVINPNVMSNGVPSAAPETTGRIFKFSSERIQTLKAQLNATLQTLVPDPSHRRWVSSNDCVAALVWSHVTRARRPHLDAFSDSRLGVAVNIRSKMDPPLSPSYFGNAALYTVAQLPIAALVGDG